MVTDALLRWLRALGRRPWRRSAVAPDDVFDRRLHDVERDQHNIEVRLRLLERQADPRDWRAHG